jgi:hypothetical protein
MKNMKVVKATDPILQDLHVLHGETLLGRMDTLPRAQFVRSRALTMKNMNGVKAIRSFRSSSLHVESSSGSELDGAQAEAGKVKSVHHGEH